MKKKLISIGELSKLTDVHIKSLRYYDKIGVLKPAFVDPKTGYRYYSYLQINTVDAIRTCIELDIPLSQFSDYAKDDGRRIHYAKLLEHGKDLAEKKVLSVREKLRGIESAQKEMIRCETLIQYPAGVTQNIPKKHYLTAAIQDTEELLDQLDVLISQAIQNKYKMGYEIGMIYFFHPQRTEKYAGVEIVSATEAGNMMTLPAGKYVSRCIDESRIEQSREEFPDMFRKDHTVLAMEFELLSGDYNIEKPLYELRCKIYDK